MPKQTWLDLPVRNEDGTPNIDCLMRRIDFVPPEGRSKHKDKLNKEWLYGYLGALLDMLLIDQKTYQSLHDRITQR